MNEESNDFDAQRIKRRSVVKAAAWAAPVVATAVAVPAVSASTEPPAASFAQVTIDSPRSVGSWGLVRVQGRTEEDGLPVNGALPEGTTIVLSASAGTISINPGGQVGVASITDNGDGTYTVIPLPGATVVELYASLDAPGVLTASLSPIPGSGNGHWE